MSSRKDPRLQEQIWSTASEEDSQKELLAKSTEAKQLRFAREKVATFVAYERLLAKLQLNQADQEKLLDLLMDKLYMREDLNELMVHRQIPKGGDWRKDIKNLEQALDGEMQSLLGPEKYAAFRGYEQKLPSNLLTTQLQQLCVISGDSLNDGKADEIAEIFATYPADAEARHPAMLPIAYPDKGQIRTSNLNLKVLGKDAWFVDLNGMLSVNYPVSENARIRTISLLSPKQQSALYALIDKQQSERTTAARLGYGQ